MCIVVGCIPFFIHQHILTSVTRIMLRISRGMQNLLVILTLYNSFTFQRKGRTPKMRCDQITTYDLLGTLTSQCTPALIEASGNGDDTIIDKILNGLPEVELAEPDSMGHGTNIGLDRINQVNLPLDGNTGRVQGQGQDVTVFDLDTGCRVTYNKLTGRATTVGIGSLAGTNGVDNQGHGTHVAAIAAGEWIHEEGGVKTHLCCAQAIQQAYAWIHKKSNK